MRAFVLLACLFVASPSSAQTGAVGSETFDAGVRAMEREDWVAAEVLFREDLEADPTDRARLHLARVLEAQGRVLEAHALAQAVAGSSDLLLADAGAALLRELEAKLGTLVVRCAGFEEPPDELRVGERLIVEGAEVLVDPGLFVVRAFVDGRVVAERTVELSPGERAPVLLEPVPVVPTARETATQAVTAEEEGDTEPRTPRRRRRALAIGLGVAGVAVVGLLVSIAVASAGGTRSPTAGDLQPWYLGGGTP